MAPRPFELLSALERYGESPLLTEEERPSLARLLAFVRDEPRCFERSLAGGHVTGSAWILDAARQRCLLTHHKKLGLWLQLGGHADGDPDVLRVALREATEESGIEGLRPLLDEIFDVDIHPIPANPREAAHEHFDVRFALVAPPGAVLRVSEESHALAWVERGALAGYGCDRSVLRMAAKWAPGLPPGAVSL
jgi:8-oxo-dGTP pyrophosphatase MutT (NUDIX family)